MKIKTEFQQKNSIKSEFSVGVDVLQSSFCEQNDKINSNFAVSNEKINCSFTVKCDTLKVPFKDFQSLQGHTPIKGVDYFTEEEINEVAEKAYELVQTGGVDTSNFIKVSQIGKNLEFDDAGKVNVVTTDEAEQDNTKPITARAVYTIVGNIDALLELI